MAGESAGATRSHKQHQREEFSNLIFKNNSQLKIISNLNLSNFRFKLVVNYIMHETCQLHHSFGRGILRKKTCYFDLKRFINMLIEKHRLEVVSQPPSTLELELL